MPREGNYRTLGPASKDICFRKNFGAFARPFASLRLGVKCFWADWKFHAKAQRRKGAKKNLELRRYRYDGSIDRATATSYSSGSFLCANAHDVNAALKTTR